jgi:cathepsin A (carboxypeptidase C)
MPAMEACNLAMSTISGIPVSPRFNLYDIRKKCDVPPLCYNFSNVDAFLARSDVIDALGVKGRKWEACNQAVHMALLGDWTTDLSSKVIYLIENGVKGLVYSGDKDFVCNWVGGETWTNALKWSHADEFNKAPYQDFTSEDGKTAFGKIKGAGNLAFLRVFDAGHMVPMDQPAAALLMLNRFITSTKPKSE